MNCYAGVSAVKRMVVPVVLANKEIVYWRLKADTYKAICSHFTQPRGIVQLYRRFRRWFLRVFFDIHTCVKPTGTVSMLNTSSGIHPPFLMNYYRTLIVSRGNNGF
jgi:hypothetical protein